MQKQKHLLFRNLILLFTLVVVVFLIAFAWFTSKQKADASGINVTSISQAGLETSFDGETEWSYSISKNVNLAFPLITGNGTDFFMPKLNLSTGVPLLDNDGKLISKREVFPSTHSATDGYKDYLLQDIYFRSDQELDVYLNKGSTVVPNALDTSVNEHPEPNLSNLGDFTRDYIAGAVRAAFFTFDETDPTTEQQAFTWVPNEKYQLTAGSGFTPIKETTSSGGETETISKNPDETFGLTDTTKYTPVNMYMWEILFDKSNNTQKGTEFKMYQSADGTYYGAIELQASTQVDHGIIITSTDYSNLPQMSFTTNVSKKGSQLDLYGHDDTHTWIGAFFEDTKYNYGDSDRVEKLTVDTNNDKNGFFGINDRFQVLIEYNPKGLASNGLQLNVAGFVFFNSVDRKPNGGAGAGYSYGSVATYEINTDLPVAIVGTNLTGSYVLAANHSSNSVSAHTVYLNGDKSITNLNIDETFTAEQKADKTKQYAFRSVAYSDRYLTINSSGKLVTGSEKTYFSLVVGDSGPLLKSGNYYIMLNANNMIASNSITSTMSIYQGNLVNFTEDGEPEALYQYYSEEAGAYVSLTNVMLTEQLSPETSNLVRLVYNEETKKYEGHIRVKIWAEGTDREAQTPLLNGVFNTHLIFEGVQVNDNT